MNNLWLTERLETLAETPGPATPPISDVVHSGRRLKQRRRAATGGGAAIVLVAAAVSGLAVSGLGAAGHGAQSKAVTLGAEPSAAPSDEGLSAPYWFTSYVATDHESVDGVDMATVEPAVDTWWGNDRPTVMARGTQDKLTQVYSEPGPVYTSDSTKFDLSKSWGDLWAAPTDQAGLIAWMAQHRGSMNGAIPVDAELMLTQPAPLALRRALVKLLETRAFTTVTQGTDDAGRPAQVITAAQADSGAQVTVYYIDATTANLLESKVLNGKPTAPSDLPEGSVDFQYVYSSDTGPVDTAPAATTGTPAPEVIAPNTTGTPTCTAGKADDPSDPVAVQLAKICLPDPAASYPVRVAPDHYGDAVARSFVVGKTAQSADTVRVQIAAHDQYFLSKASTPTPDAAGKVGTATFVASTTVLGVTASEVEQDGGKMLVLEKDGLGIEVVGSGSTTFADLIGVADQVQGIGPA